MSEAGPVVAGAPPAAPHAVGFGEALRFWLQLGFVSFGGPAGQIALLQVAAGVFEALHVAFEKELGA